MTGHTQAPTAALLCTHKRGAGLVVFRVDPQGMEISAAQAAERLAELCGAQPVAAVLPLTKATVHWLSQSGGSCVAAVSSGLTAENLADLYRSALDFLGCEDPSVTALGVVSGPGSFTGLRLGCAFANGLALGRSRELWSVAGVPPDQIRTLCAAIESRAQPAFWGEVSPEADDPFAVPTAFADLLVHLQNWAHGQAERVDVLEPVYGREPTPVLKLRQQQGGSLS